MQFAKSFKNARLYSASSITPEEAKLLDLICPKCGAKVFKRRRNIPTRNDCFVHHRGGTPECEDYHPSHEDVKSAGFATVAQGQDFALFIQHVAHDMHTMLVRTGAISKVNRPEFDMVLNFSEKQFQFPTLGRYFEDVDAQAHKHLRLANVKEQSAIVRVLDTKLLFYRNPQARFIDPLIVAWVLYAKGARKADSASKRLIASLAKPARWASAAGLFLAGLASYDFTNWMPWFALRFADMLDALPRIDLAEPARDKVAQSRDLAAPEPNARGNSAFSPISPRENLVLMGFVFSSETTYLLNDKGEAISVATAPNGQTFRVKNEGDLLRIQVAVRQNPSLLRKRK